MKTINLKLSEELHAALKSAAKSIHNKSMQEILEAFVVLYVENPNQFTIKTEVRNVIIQHD